MKRPAKARKTVLSYTLSVHYKQGDDLARYVEATKSSAEALREWADSFRQHADACEKIARSLDGVTVKIEADTHCIWLHPEGADAERALADLAKDVALKDYVLVEEVVID